MAQVRSFNFNNHVNTILRVHFNLIALKNSFMNLLFIYINLLFSLAHMCGVCVIFICWLSPRARTNKLNEDVGLFSVNKQRILWWWLLRSTSLVVLIAFVWYLLLQNLCERLRGKNAYVKHFQVSVLKADYVARVRGVKERRALDWKKKQWSGFDHDLGKYHLFKAIYIFFKPKLLVGYIAIFIVGV